jgi:hypothetical protein
MATQPLTHEKIVEAVQTWPNAQRLKLVQDILKDLTEEYQPKPAPKNTLDRALGLLRKYTDAPPPTDEEVERWLEEERLRKYGG